MKENHSSYFKHSELWTSEIESAINSLHASFPLLKVVDVNITFHPKQPFAILIIKPKNK